jgi:hypothetical protein
MGIPANTANAMMTTIFAQSGRDMEVFVSKTAGFPTPNRDRYQGHQPPQTITAE